MRTYASRLSQKVRDVKVAVKRSYCSKMKEKVEALRWLMQCVVSMEQLICGLHEGQRSSVSRNRPTQKYPELIPEFDARYAWTSRDRVIIDRMTTYLARERQNVFVERKEMGKDILSPLIRKVSLELPESSERTPAP